MDRKFTVKEIAFQAGLSPATVDRALHARKHVRQVTRDRVAANWTVNTVRRCQRAANSPSMC
ncbi:MAG: LacI family DNA-binding transcriptional regulator [Marivivens sp.]|uniref:LacI family DNA-binding transcriptional regulator n=1 Tax=Marivivens sp. TaxID=1978374 RepID=UPI00182C4B54|nr:LacI family DNA-binding transcriptional regulator [Marivivens sp.]